MSSHDSGALFILPSTATGQSLMISSWFHVAGWAAGARDVLGRSWILTPEGVLDAEEARRRASSPAAPTTKRRTGLRSHIPLSARMAYKDVRQALRARKFRTAGATGPWTSYQLAFIWQRHDLFYSTGMFAAKAFARPLVLFVDAPVVWEHRRWNVPRPPGWGHTVEALGENRQFRTADLVACVSQEVAEEVGRRGVAENRIVVTPNGVDLELFSDEADGSVVRERHGLTGKRVVGWVGTFRSFHGIELAVEAVRAVQEQVPDVALLFVGEGAERQTIERLCRSRGIDHAAFTGAVPHHMMASHLNAMDVGLVLSGQNMQFHYSPMKLREYMACGVPVIAPRVGEMSRMLRDGADALLVEPADAASLARAILRVLTDDDLGECLSVAGRRRMASEGSWKQPVQRVLDALSETDSVLRG